MAEFVIRLSDERGHVTEQVESAGSESEVRERLSRRGALVVGVKPRGLVIGGKLALSKIGKVKLGQFVFFYQQLVTLIHHGLPNLRALDLLWRQEKDRSGRDLLQAVGPRAKVGAVSREAS